MIQRCYNPKVSSFKYYGAKGVKVCDSWLGKDGFSNFKLDMGSRPEGTSLDRINVAENYTPQNCRWVNSREQAINQGKRSDNKSGFFGVYFETKRNRWRATIKNYSKTKFLGYFSTAKDAALAYDSAAKALHGSNAKQNFK
jgi:hypothetical protein